MKSSQQRPAAKKKTPVQKTKKSKELPCGAAVCVRCHARCAYMKAELQRELDELMR